jgi:hypothetical protein
MNPTATMLRWYRQSTGRAVPQHQYTAEEVLQLLRPDHSRDDRDARIGAVRQVAAQPAAWLGNLTKQQRQEIGQLADRLPSLLFHHTSGAEPTDLLRQFGGWSAWRYERALEVAGNCIASHLNRG